MFLALHPPKLRELLPLIRRVTTNSLVVSLAPKITLAELESACGTSRVARVIPNAPSIMGQGSNPDSFSHDGGDDVDAALSRMLTGSVATMFQSGLAPSEVMDLIPVKPLAPLEPQIVATYNEALAAVYAKILPVTAAA